MAYSHIAHDCQLGDNCIFSNNSTLAGHVTVGDHVTLAGMVAVHQFCRIGRHSFIAGGSLVRKDIPPYVKKFSFFDLTPILLDSCIVCANQKGSFTFTMRATNCNWDMLHLHIYKDGPNTCIISQPEFEIMKPF